MRLVLDIIHNMLNGLYVFPHQCKDILEGPISDYREFLQLLDEWLKIGKKGLNRDVQNAAFSDKVSIYKKSSCYCAKQISLDYTEWNDSSIMKLQSEMANAAVSIWKVSI